MPGPVERWLETFMCQQYADTFEGYGFKTLQSVSYKTTKHLQNGFLNHQCSFVKKCDISVVSFFFRCASFSNHNCRQWVLHRNMLKKFLKVSTFLDRACLVSLHMCLLITATWHCRVLTCHCVMGRFASKG